MKPSSIIPNVEVTVFVACTSSTLNEPLVSPACVVWNQLYHQLYAYELNALLCTKLISDSACIHAINYFVHFQNKFQLQFEAVLNSINSDKLFSYKFVIQRKC